MEYIDALLFYMIEPHLLEKFFGYIQYVAYIILDAPFQKVSQISICIWIQILDINIVSCCFTSASLNTCFFCWESVVVPTTPIILKFSALSRRSIMVPVVEGVTVLVVATVTTILH